MISAAFYRTVYQLVVVCMTIFVMQRYVFVDFSDQERPSAYNNRIPWMLTLFLIFFIGFRPISREYFVDMSTYAVHFKAILWGRPFQFKWDTDNVLFDNLFALWGALKFSVEYFFLLMAGIYFVCMMIACRKLFPKDALLSLLVYLGALSTFSYGTNGMKAGAAASLFLLAMANMKSLWKAVLCLMLSLGFHHSMIVPIVAFAVASLFRNPKYYLGGWLVCLFLAAIHVTGFMDFFSGLADEQGAAYLDTDVKDAALNVSGFRPDFILYSAVPIFLGYYFMRKGKIESDTYKFLWCTYTLSNCVFLLCTYGSFINRIAYLSWLMYPIVLIYPFLHADLGYFHHRYLKYAVYGHLGFTLFMFLIYYA